MFYIEGFREDKYNQHIHVKYFPKDIYTKRVKCKV